MLRRARVIDAAVKLSGFAVVGLAHVPGFSIVRLTGKCTIKLAMRCTRSTLFIHKNNKLT